LWNEECRADSQQILAVPQRKQFDMASETDFNKAVRILMNQGISVSPNVMGTQGLTFNVLGYVFTEMQIVELNRRKKLYPNGIREFAKEFGPAPDEK